MQEVYNILVYRITIHIIKKNITYEFQDQVMLNITLQEINQMLLDFNY
jgi:hypothetical protein